jgi:hypothetical protein
MPTRKASPLHGIETSWRQNGVHVEHPASTASHNAPHACVGRAGMLGGEIPRATRSVRPP